MEVEGDVLVRAGIFGDVVVGADSGFYSRRVVDACERHGAYFSVSVRLQASHHKLIEEIEEAAWEKIPGDGSLPAAPSEAATFDAADRATTDPEEDSQPVLKAYAGSLGASWTFVTGPRRHTCCRSQRLGFKRLTSPSERSSRIVLRSRLRSRSG